MTPARFQRWLRKEIEGLNAFAGIEFDLSHCDSATATLQEAGRYALILGHPQLAALCHAPDLAAPTEAKAILSKMIAAVEDIPGELLNMEQAAKVLGCSVSGLRKLVNRGVIRYSQDRKHSAIRFRREWLAEYVEDRSDQPNTPAARQRKRKRIAPPISGDHGFDLSLLA